MHSNITQINLGLSIVLLVVIIWQFFKIHRLDIVRKHFYSVGLKTNLEDLMAQHNQQITTLDSQIKDLNSQTQNLRTLNQNNFQKLGFVRFSQFGEAGNFSFALVVLDAHNNGVVISSLHGRDGCRVYSKDIKNSKSTAKFTEEEKQALTQALT